MMPAVTVNNYKGVKVERVKNARSDEDAVMKMKDAILDKIVDANDIEVPQSMVQDEVTRMVCELSQQLKYQAMQSGDYSYLQRNDMADHMEEIKEEAVRLLKTKLVLKGIIEAENLEVTKEELEKEAKAISVRQQMPIEMVKDFFGEEFAQLKDDLLVRKAIDFVYANAVII